MRFSAEWTALSGDADYPGSKCASVITLADPAGNILKTDRSNQCSGTTPFELRSSKNGTGEFTAKASIAPWDDPEKPVVSDKTFTVIENGA